MRVLRFFINVVSWKEKWFQLWGFDYLPVYLYITSDHENLYQCGNLWFRSRGQKVSYGMTCQFVGFSGVPEVGRCFMMFLFVDDLYPNLSQILSKWHPINASNLKSISSSPVTLAVYLLYKQCFSIFIHLLVNEHVAMKHQYLSS